VWPPRWRPTWCALADPVAQVIAAWSPLISWVPIDRRLLATARLVATTGVAGIAAWVRCHHIAAVAVIWSLWPGGWAFTSWTCT